MTYRKAILKAVDALHDTHLRSSVKEIRKHVENNLDPGQTLNFHAFLTDVKALVEEGDLELNSMQCGLSPEYKKRKVNVIRDRFWRMQKMQLSNPTSNAFYNLQPSPFTDPMKGELDQIMDTGSKSNAGKRPGILFPTGMLHES